MIVSYDGIGQVCATFLNSGAAINEPCRIAYNNGVSGCMDGNQINGVVVAIRENLATVAVKGIVTLPFTGSAPSLGYCPLAGAGSGKVKKLEGAREYLVVYVNSTQKTVTFYL